MIWMFVSCHMLQPPQHSQAVLNLAQSILQQADVDGDGVLNKAEYTVVALPDDPIRLHDQDQDGTLDLNEIVAILETVDPSQQQESRRRGGQPRGKGKRR